MNKAIATEVMLLILAGSVTAGLVTYKVYQTYETIQTTSKSIECINKKLDFCTMWSNLDFNPASKPPWDISCGDEPTDSMCKNIVKGTVTAGSTTISTSTSTSTSSTSTSTTSASTTSSTSTSTSTSSTSTTSTSTTSTTIPGELLTGINYLSAGNRWIDSNSQLDADFSRFSNDGIKHISVRIMWSVMEPTHSDTSTNLDLTSLSDIKRVLTEANKYGIKVNLDFWTQHGSTLGLPSWVSSYWDIEAIPEIRNHYVRYMQTVVNELKSYPALESWTVLNEPWFGTASDGTDVGKTEFQETFPILYNAIKSVDPDHIVTCRFTLSYTPGSGRFDQSVYDVFDIFALTEYLDPSNPSDTRYNGRWSYWDNTISQLKARNEYLWVIEFGDDNADEEHVRLHYEQSLQKFNAAGIVQRAYAWAWQTRSASSEPFNIFDGTNPKPAYYELTSSTSTSSTSSSTTSSTTTTISVTTTITSPTGTIWAAHLYVPSASSATTYLSNTVFQAAKEMGITHIHIWQYNFDTQSRTISRSQLVDAVRRMKAYGLQPIIDLEYNVTEAVALVTELGSDCMMYEVGKEPHISGTGGSATVDEYVNYFNQIVSACRQVNPDAMYGGPTVGSPTTSPESRSGVYVNAYLQRCDGDFLSVHSYPGGSTKSEAISNVRSNTISDVQQLKSKMTQYGKNLPIVISEISWTSAEVCKGYDCQNPDCWDCDQNFNDQWTTALMSTTEEQDIYAIVFWVLIGYDNNFAIIRPPSQSYQKKPQYYSIQKYLSSQSSTTSTSTTIPIPSSLSVIISTPDDESAFTHSESINFYATAIGGTEPYTYNWVSSIDGDIGNLFIFDKNDLSVGNHIINLTVTDSVGRKGTDTIVIHIPPDYFDWRNVNGSNWMTSIKVQECGDCWAFATIGVEEAKYNIQNNNPNLDVDLSEQYLVSGCCNLGSCNGGTVGFGCDTTTEQCYPYLGIDSTCPTSCNDGSSINLWKTTAYDIVTPQTRGSIQYSLTKKGPLFIAIDVTSSTGQIFPPTSRTDKDGCPVYACGGGTSDHGVVLVGYNNTGQYWIIKNSWGVGNNPCSWLGGDGYESIDYTTCNTNDLLRYTFYVEGILPP